MPEETNRVLTDHAADLLFAPTERAVRALDREGITAGVHHTGDVMVDALRWARQVARHRSDVCTSFPFGREEYVVATIHRELNTDHLDRLRAIISGLGRLELPVVLPMHPRTRQRLEQAGAYGWAAERVHVIDPVGYFAFVDLLASAARVVTDSGGVQKEAFLLDTPCVTIREETEWPETVDAGWNTLADADPDVIQEAVTAPVLIEDKPQPFGDGTAAQTIRRRLEEAIEDGIGIRDGSLEPFEAADYQRGN